MKKKSIVSILIALLFVLLSYIYINLNYGINITKHQVENIDTSFFNNEMKIDLLKIIKVFKETKIRYIEVIDNEIIYYDLNHNKLSGDNLLGFFVKNILEKNKINEAYYFISSKNEIDDIYFNLGFSDLFLVYKVNTHNFQEGFIIPVLIGRVEKVIDDNWFILKGCNRNICQEPQG